MARKAFKRLEGQAATAEFVIMAITWRELGILSDAANLDDFDEEVILFPETVEDVEAEELRQAAEDAASNAIEG